MAWLTPSNRATGDLITAAIWNQDVVANPAYLKGQAGVVLFENSIAPTADTTFDVGNSFTARWNNIYSMHHWAFGHGGLFRRQNNMNWDMGSLGTVKVGTFSGNGASVKNAGANQIVIYCDETNGVVNAAGIYEDIDNLNGGATVNIIMNKKPYIRNEFHMASFGVAGTIQFWMGMRDIASASNTSMPTSSENVAIFRLNTGSVEVFVANGGTATATTTVDVSAWLTTGTRHALEIFQPNATRIEFAIDGTVRATATANIPGSGATLLAVNAVKATIANIGGGTVRTITLGKWVVEQDIN